MELEKEILAEEGLDLRFFLLRLFNSIWIVFVAALAGAAICAGGYMLLKCINPAMKEYSRETKYYIDFAEDSTGVGYGYYNDYTWNDWMKSDAIMNYTLSLLPENISKEAVENAVTADIISDVRLLTITVRTSDAAVTESIADATAEALIHFPEDIKEIDAIRVIRDEPVKEIVAGDLTKRLAVFGLVCGAVISLFWLCLVYCADTSVYLPKDIEKRFQLPVLGVLYKKQNRKEDEEDNREELLVNAQYLLSGKKRITLLWFGAPEKEIQRELCEVLKKAVQPGEASVGAEEPEIAETFFKEGKMPDYAMLRRADAIAAVFYYGGADGKQAERYLSDLKKQNCEVTTAILCSADKKLYRRYYFGRKKS